MKQKRNPLTGRWDLTGKDVTDTWPLRILIVDELPATWEEWVIYIVEGTLYSTMYVWDPDHRRFVKVGTTKLSVQEQSDWLEDDPSEVTYIKNKPILAEVAYSGSYEDLIDAPEVPEVYNTRITFKKNWSIVWVISTNQTEESEIDFTIPTKTSDLENDVPFLTEEDIPTVPTKLSELENDTGFVDKYVNNLEFYTKTEDLADVALSNDYNDLDNKPTIPTKLSDLTNDTWFIDNTTNNLLNYRNKTNSYSKTQIDELLAWLSSLRVEVVTELPNPWEFWVIYLIESETPGMYYQYILTELPNTYAMIWSTAVDLTNYFNKVTDTSDDIVQWDTNLFMTQAERINLSHQSWYNTGDETKTTICQKLGPASATNDWYLKKEDWREFDSKVDYDDFVWQDVSGWTVVINNYSTEITTGSDITVNTGSSVKEGLVYLLRVNATADMKLNLWSIITNDNDVDLNVPAGHTKIFTMLALSDTVLAMQWIDTTNLVKRSELKTVAFTNNYNDLDNKPASPVIPTVNNWTLTIYQDWEYKWYFKANQASSTVIELETGPMTTNNMYTTIRQFDDTEVVEHWLWKTPKYVNIEWYSNYGRDEKGRLTASRYMISWTQNWTEIVWTIIHLSDWTQDSRTEDIRRRDNPPMQITVTSSEIRLTPYNNMLTKVRITAYL